MSDFTYPYFMSEARLSAVGLRLAAEVGQRTLDRVASDPAARAELDQHAAAVRSAVTDCAAGPRAAAAVAGRAAVEARVGAAGCAGLGELLSAIAGSSPDVPFAADEGGQQESLPLTLLLHYVCGFVEEAVIGDWWPDRAARPDWESMRLAAACRLIADAEAAADQRPGRPQGLTARRTPRSGPAARRARGLPGRA
jgi:hypothetical protein